MKKIFFILYLIMISVVGLSYADSKMETGYFIFDKPKQIEFSSANIEDIAKTLKLQDKKGAEYDVVINVIGTNKIAISPIEKIEEPLKIKDKKDYIIKDYDGNIYVQNQENLEKIAAYLEKKYVPYPVLYSAEVKDTSKELKAERKSDAGKTEDYSKTNVQTKGIDEADIVKTDGKYIYFIRKNSLVVVDSNTKNLKVVATIKEQEEKFLRDIYVDSKKLYLIYDSNKKQNDIDKQITIVDIYDIRDITKIQKLKTNTLNGYYQESRKKGNELYVITDDYFRVSYIDNYNFGYKLQGFTQEEKTKSIENKKYKYDTTGIDLTKMLYIAFNPATQVININALSSNESSISNTLSYMGTSGNVYMSNDNLYIASGVYDYNEKTGYFNETTNIKKFAVDKNKFNYVGQVDVYGTLVNQFSLNEENNNLFVAYTKKSGEDSENIIDSFDKNMKKISSLNNLAKGEKIYSARFMQGKVYLVTFKEVDPLFVIDISKPENMKVLGYLKIPGYSNYLHPYKDGYLIGFGQKTKQKSAKTIVNDGFKIALFDVRDFTKPKQVDVKNIGARGSYSYIESDHKALMFDEKRDVFMIPVSVNKVDKKVYEGELTEDVSLSFVGAYLIKVSEKGFNIKSKISHYTDKQQKEINDYQVYDYDKQILRGIQIGDNLYTLSDYAMKVNNINTTKEIGFLKF